MDGWVGGWMGRWMDGWVGGWMTGWMCVCANHFYRSLAATYDKHRALH